MRVVPVAPKAVRIAGCWQHPRCTVYAFDGRRRKHYVHVAEVARMTTPTQPDYFRPSTTISLDKVLRKRYSPSRS